MSEQPIAPATGPRSIVWLASYPKSGNTWVRAFLGNYLIDHGGPMPLEALAKISSGDSSAAHYTELTGKQPEAITLPEQMRARQVVLARIARQSSLNLVKTHFPNAAVAGVPLIPPAVTGLAVQIVRNPLDMILSYADHFGLSHAAAAAAIADPKNHVPATHKTVAQFLGTWSDHVRSWSGAKGFPVVTVRYEDLLARPEVEFERILKAMGAPIDSRVMAQAVKYASFGSLSSQEEATGFHEKGAAQERFFRVGKSGGWKDSLYSDVADRIRRDHAEVMALHGYL